MLTVPDALIDGEALRAELFALAGPGGEPLAAGARRHHRAPQAGAGRRPRRGRAAAHGRRPAARSAPAACPTSRTRSSASSTTSPSSNVYPTRNRSTAERMAVVAVGGYGRGTLAPGSDVDLLFLLPYKQTPWGESVVEFILYVLWDLGLKVGHATRSVDECIRLARSDMTIRTAVLEARYIWGERAALRRAGRRASTPRWSRAPAPRIHRRQARRARHAPPPAGRLALSGRAQRQGRQGRPARPPHALLDRQVFLSRQLARRAGQGRRLLARRAQPLPQGRGFPVGGALPPPLPDRPRRGAALLRRPARAWRCGSATPPIPA